MTTLVTAADVARLARVRRPVVSVWRTRYANSAEPFPEALPGAADVRFDLDQVGQWLALTGRGNNADVLADLDRFRGVGDAAVSQLMRDSALVALRHALGGDLGDVTTEWLCERAREVDPGDTHLLREIVTSTTLESDAARVVRVADATYGSTDLHDLVVGEALGKTWAPWRDTALTNEAGGLIRVLLSAMLHEAGPDPVLVDRTGASPFVLSLLDESVTVQLAAGTSDAHRVMQRMLRIWDQSMVDQAADLTGAGSVDLVLLPSPAHLKAGDVAHLRGVQAAATHLGSHSSALVVAPAALLVDRLDGPAGRLRDDLIRSGQLRCAVRLAEGGRVSRPREHLALWILGAPAESNAEHQVVQVADLSGSRLGGVISARLVDDVIATLRGGLSARGRAWGLLRPVPRSNLLANWGSLVRAPRPTAARRRAPTVDLELRLSAADRWRVLDPYRWTPGAPSTLPVYTLAECQQRGWLSVHRGSRVNASELPSGAATVMAVDDGTLWRRPGGVDLLTLLASTPARTTQAGDIVFVGGARPQALVDSAGGSLVLAPAQVLRISPGAPLVAEAVASMIRSAPATTRWRSWAVTPIPQSGDLAGVLDDVAAIEARLIDETRALREFRSQLIDAVAGRHLGITRKDPAHGETAVS